MLWSDGTDLRDAEHSVVSSLERASVRVVWVSDFELEESRDSGWVDDLASVGRHLVTNEVECEVDVLKEE